MAGSTIIPEAYLIRRLPADYTNSNSEVTESVFRASDFCNSWARRYDPFDEYQSSPLDTLAPDIIVDACTAVAEAMYFMAIGQRYRDGNEEKTWQSVLDYWKKYLQEVHISPKWYTQTISLDSNNAMVIGTRNAGGMWPRVIPHTAQVISATTNVWILGDDFSVKNGGDYTDEYPDAWYFYAETSSVEGTLRYMRTFRNDAYDYMKYGKS